MVQHLQFQTKIHIKNQNHHYIDVLPILTLKIANNINCGYLEFEQINVLNNENMNIDTLGSMAHPLFWKNLTKELLQK
jgi:hypothetical protein